MKRLRSTHLMILAAFSWMPNPGLAQNRPPTIYALRDVAKDVCAAPVAYGFSRSASGEVGGHISTPKLFRGFADAGIDASVKGGAADWQGLLQRDLSANLIDHRHCSQAVFSTMIDVFYGRTLGTMPRRPPTHITEPSSISSSGKPSFPAATKQPIAAGYSFAACGTLSRTKTFYTDIYIVPRSRKSDGFEAMQDAFRAWIRDQGYDNNELNTYCWMNESLARVRESVVDNIDQSEGEVRRLNYPINDRRAASIVEYLKDNNKENRITRKYTPSDYWTRCGTLHIDPVIKDAQGRWIMYMVVSDAFQVRKETLGIVDKAFREYISRSEFASEGGSPSCTPYKSKAMALNDMYQTASKYHYVIKEIGWKYEYPN